jgi:RNA polymerase sigma factor (sigma-70 family)
LVASEDDQRDEQLLRASCRQPARFVELYDRALPGLLAYFVRRTLDAQVAADLAAETLAAAYAARDRFHDRGPGSASAWLYTIAGRQLSHYLRHLRVEDRARRRLGLDPIALGPDDIERIEALIDFERLGRQVKEAFAALRSDQRDALRLRVLEGRTYGETAAALGCSEAAARARVSRGLRRLAAQLQSEVTP